MTLRVYRILKNVIDLGSVIAKSLQSRARLGHACDLYIACLASRFSADFRILTCDSESRGSLRATDVKAHRRYFRALANAIRFLAVGGRFAGKSGSAGSVGRVASFV